MELLNVHITVSIVYFRFKLLRAEQNLTHICRVCPHSLSPRISLSFFLSSMYASKTLRSEPCVLISEGGPAWKLAETLSAPHPCFLSLSLIWHLLKDILLVLHPLPSRKPEYVHKLG